MGDREKILQKVEEKTGVTRKELWERVRLKRVISARKIFQMCLRMYGLTTSQIGVWMHRDHSSVAFNTTHAKETEKELSMEILLELGIEPKKMMTMREWNEKIKTIKRVYIPKPRKPAFVKKIVPDYQNNVCVERWVEKC